MPASTRGSKRKTLRPDVTVASKATAICDAFFNSMDLDANGVIVESEAKKISMCAFGEDSMAAARRWQAMLRDCDQNKDQKISREEYTEWWMKKAASKVQKDGKFAAGYAEYLIEKLTTLQRSVVRSVVARA